MSTDPVIEMQTALLSTGYRSSMPSVRRRFALLTAASRLCEAGMSPADLLELGRLAKAQGEDPEALLAHWLDAGQWRSVLDEDRSKTKEAACRAAAGASRDALSAGGLLDGIFGVDG